MAELRNRNGAVAALTPNWSSPVQSEYEFQTSIIPHHDGTEQREAMRSTGRQRISFTAMVKSERMARLLGDMASNMDAVVSVPMPWRKVTITAAAGDTVTVDSVPFWMVAGGRVILYSDTHEEAAEIASVAGSDVTMTSALSATFANGDKLVCALPGRFETGTQFEALTSRVWTGDVAYNIDPGVDPQANVSITPDQFESVDIFPWKPNWSETPKITFTDQRDILDHGRGIVADYNPVAFITQQQSMTFLGRTFDDTEEMIAFFNGVYGRQIAFWMPTYQSEITVLSMETNNVIVEGLEFYSAFLDSNVYNVVHFDGQLNRVSAVQATGGNTRLVMTDAWTTAPVAGDYLCWAPLWRMATDKLIVEWQTNSVAELKMTMQTLPNEAP